MKQIIIARKDLAMSPGKLSAQVAHASISFLTKFIRDNAYFNGYVKGNIDENILNNWIKGSFTKIVCQAKNKSQLMKAVTIAEELGLKCYEDYFMIFDPVDTELMPDIFDNNNVARYLTCIGFKPLDDEIADKISKKFELYKE